MIITDDKRHCGILIESIVAKTAQIIEARGYVERAAQRVKILRQGQSRTCRVGFLLAVDVDVVFRIVTRHELTVIDHGLHIESERRQALRLETLEVPIIRQVHILVPERRQRTILRQRNYIIERQPQLRGRHRRNQNKNYQKKLLFHNINLRFTTQQFSCTQPGLQTGSPTCQSSSRLSLRRRGAVGVRSPYRS